MNFAAALALVLLGILCCTGGPPLALYVYFYIILRFMYLLLFAPTVFALTYLYLLPLVLSFIAAVKVANPFPKLSVYNVYYTYKPELFLNPLCLHCGGLF